MQQRIQQQTPADTTPPRDAQTVNTMARYMDNMANTLSVESSTFTAVNERFAKITATVKILAESNTSFAAIVADQSKELRSLCPQLNKNKHFAPPHGSRVASWVRGKYFHTHGYVLGKNHTSTKCFMPGDSHECSATRWNTMCGLVLNKGWDAV